MIKIKKFKEKWVNGVKFQSRYVPLNYYEIFKNPSIKELRDACILGARGVILRNGELYVIGFSCDFIHEDIIQILNKANIIANTWLKNWYNDINSLNEFLCVIQGTKDLFIFAIAESYHTTDEIDIKLEIFNQYIINFKKENPNYTLKLVKGHRL